jgi:heptosyltransferase-2
MSKPKILVIRGGAIGDFILTLPAIAALRQQFPQAHLEVLGYPHIVQLAVAGGLVDRTQAIEARGLAGFFARHGELSEDLRDYFSEFDLIVSYLYDPDEIFRTNVTRCSPAQFIAGPHRPDEKERIHATQVYLKPLERLAIFDADPVPHLSVNSQPSTVNQLAVNPGSGSERKNWPEAKWAGLMGQLVEASNLDMLLVGGEAEKDGTIGRRAPAGVAGAQSAAGGTGGAVGVVRWIRGA